MKTNQSTFEVLLVDQSEISEITTVKSLVMGVSYSEKLWKNPTVSSDQSKITDSKIGVTFEASKWHVPSLNKATFLATSSSDDVQAMELFRENFLAHVVHKLGFNTIRVLRDTVSDTFSLGVVSLLKSVEDAARIHVEKTMIQKSGLDWWKSIGRDSNAGTHQWAGLPETQTLALSFHDLTTVISNNDVVSTAFKDKWQSLASLREKAIGSGTFTSQEYLSAEKLGKEVLEELGATLRLNPESSKERVLAEPVNYTAPQKQKDSPSSTIESTVTMDPEISVVSVPAAAKEPTQAPTAEKFAPPVVSPTPTPPVQQPLNDGSFKLITESILLQELKIAEGKAQGKYIDFKTFVTTSLVPKGYSLGPTYMVAKSMDEKGLVKIYEMKDERGFAVRAIRLN